jgi:hypothetical protein
MKRTFLIAILALTISAGPAVSSAFAWANGPYGGNGYGTHDWVLDEAIGLAGEEAAWLDRDTALTHTDDPDNLDGVLRGDPLNHIYNLTRTGCGAPQRVADLYYQAVASYGAGDVESASRYIGELSHYYSDICQPYHTVWDPTDPRVPAEHIRYELAVDDYHRHPGNVASWIAPAPRTPLRDVRARTVSAAYAARADYGSLKAAFRSDGFSTRSSTPVGAITRARMSRAANDLADIIAAVPTGRGLAAQPRFVSVSPSRRYPSRTSKVAARAKMTDQNGAPLEGVRVTFAWAFPSGTVKTVAYTRGDGVATSWQSMALAKRGRTLTVTARSTSNGITIAKSTWVKVR